MKTWPTWLMFEFRLKCESITPLGSPVLPLEKQPGHRQRDQRITCIHLAAMEVLRHRGSGDRPEIPMSLWQAGYSKDEEFEADREGLRIAAAVGYSPRGAVDQLERLTKLEREYVIHAETPIDELSDLAIECLQGYFRSHPLPSERLAQVDAIIAQDHLPMNRPLTPLSQCEIPTKLPRPRNSEITTQ